jgi:hypothetical protein
VRHDLVGGGPCGLQVLAGADRVQYPPAGRDQRAVSGAVRPGQGGAGVEKIGIGAFGPVDGDWVALDWVFRIALGRQYDRDRRALVPVQLRCGLQIAGCRRVQQARERGGEPVQDHLRLRVAEARVELHHADAPAGQG